MNDIVAFSCPRTVYMLGSTSELEKMEKVGQHSYIVDIFSAVPVIIQLSDKVNLQIILQKILWHQ